MLYGDSSIMLYVAGGFLIAVIATAIVIIAARLIGRKLRELTPPKRDYEMDIANMMILFQSMRDILRQQKELAAEINQSVEKKIAYVHETVERALDELVRVQESQRQLAVQLEEAQTDLVNLRRRTGEDVPDPVRPAASGNGSGDIHHPDVSERASNVGNSAMRVVAEPNEPPEEAADTWVGLDFGEADDDRLDAFDVPEVAPEEPEDAETAREAFRALLDMPATPEPLTSSSASASSSQTNAAGTNGAALHSRVYEYTDAGMSIHQIARELGIGKGEVRLILSLRKDKGY